MTVNKVKERERESQRIPEKSFGGKRKRVQVSALRQKAAVQLGDFGCGATGAVVSGTCEVLGGLSILAPFQ